MNFPLPPNLAPWTPVFAAAAFVVFWCTIIAVISVMGGWYRLSRLYPAGDTSFRIEDEHQSRTFRWASLSLGPRLLPTNYGNCVTVVVSDEVVQISVIILFRTLHPPLFIPWSAVRNCSLDRHFMIFTRATVEVAGSTHPLRFYGSCAREIDLVWQSRATASQEASGGVYGAAEHE